MQWFTDLTGGFSLGLGVWFASWGFNRVYLFFKMLVS